MGSTYPPHVIIFPFMAQGHTLPLLDLAKVLSHRAIKVTIITTPSNAKQIFSPDILTHVLPFPIVDGLPQGCENTMELTSQDQLLSFLRATRMLKRAFESYLRELVESGEHPICVICDFFLGWVISICSKFNIHGVLFHGMGVLSTSISLNVYTSKECIKRLFNGEKLETLPWFECPFPVILDDFDALRDEDHPMAKFLQENGEGGASSKCWGVVCNSFEGLEGEFVGSLEGSYGRGIKVWCVGPFFLYDQEGICKVPLENGYQKWLDEQEGVMYVSFGTQSHVSNDQLDEIAVGLEMAGYRFIWVVRSSNWTPPKGWEDRVGGKGLVIREWVDQKSILSHKAIQGFLSHCGWNSVLESLSIGVPILVWPLDAEQPLNAKFLVCVLKVGLAIDPTLDETKKEGVRFGCKAISSGVKELMGGEGGRVARERAKEVAYSARKAVEKDGSSSKKLDQLINSLME